ncbi:MAG: alpha/beta hydrolase family protein [Tepidanaerobacteraceae bacterium]
MARGQSWVMDGFLSSLGWDVLHPGAKGFFGQLGYILADIDRTFSKVKSAEMLPKAWGTTGAERENEARFYLQNGLKGAAKEVYLRAALLYGRAQYSYYGDTPQKVNYNKAMVRCYEKVLELEDTPCERKNVLFDNKKVFYVLHLPAKEVKEPVPLVILLPGMDMIKEDWHWPSHKYFLSKNIATVAIDGPGQGETLFNGLKVTLDNYEKAVSKVLDEVTKRPEIDANKIVLIGTSMGSYWGPRCAAYDKRIKGCAALLGAYAVPEGKAFDEAQPNFRTNFLYMTGLQEGPEFEELISNWTLDTIANKINVPMLLIHGEFDELTKSEYAIKFYNELKTVKQLWIYENEFHPLGNVAQQVFTASLDWLLNVLKNEKIDNKILYFATDGKVNEISGLPWWSPEDWLELKSSRTL